MTGTAGQPVSLRPLHVTDVDEMHEVLADPALYTYTGGRPPTRTELERRYAAQARGTSPDGSQLWLNRLVVVADRAVGYVQATVPLGSKTAEIAWVVGTPWQGRGYAVAAVRLLVDELADRGVRQLVAHIHPGHTASRRLATRIGLERTDIVVEGEERWTGSAPAAGP